MKKILTALEVAAKVTFILALLWLFLSYCDIVADNNSGHPVHSPYNFFTLAFPYKG